MSRIILVVLLIVPLGCTNNTVTSEPSAENLARDFHGLSSKGLRFVDGGLAGLCRAETPEDRKWVENHYGPHVYHHVGIYLNPTADHAERGKPFPAGSAIVKEKFFVISSKRMEDGVGGMIKRAPGYDPANGDWEYFFAEPSGKLQTGKLASCINCHRGAADTDFVFREWDEEGVALR